jgi:hypothetical protein
LLKQEELGTDVDMKMSKAKQAIGDGLRILKKGGNSISQAK